MSRREPKVRRAPTPRVRLTGSRDGRLTYCPDWPAELIEAWRAGFARGQAAAAAAARELEVVEP